MLRTTYKINGFKVLFLLIFGHKLLQHQFFLLFHYAIKLISKLPNSRVCLVPLEILVDTLETLL